MDTLEQFLLGDFANEKQEADSLDRAIARAVLTFDSTFVDDWWPYAFDVTNSLPIGQGKSQGTSAMVLAAVGKALGRFDPESLSVVQPDLKAKWNKAFAAVLADVKKKSAGSHVRSSTFGANNPLTLSHLADLVRLLAPVDTDLADELGKVLKDAKDAVASKFASPISRETKFLDQPPGYQTNSFVPLRAILAIRALDPNFDLRSHRVFFENTLHDQLSFSSIPDSRFDPAELIFCLEGFLRCAPAAVDEALFSRVLEVLAEAQLTSAHWRPNKPFTASATGSINLPLSVEGANSLIRSVRLMERKSVSSQVAAQCVPLLRRFWGWLRARSIRFGDPKSPCEGWHSEHVNEPGLVHIWDTSQILEFLLAYRALLHEHSGKTALRLSGLKVRPPNDLDDTVAGTQGEPAVWTDVVTHREPVDALGAVYRVYERVGSDFIDPRLGGVGQPDHSMLLYGPPGTGKSSLAKLVADALQWPMITVTVSDFLGLGGAMVESRAKAIFETLELQSKAVILFDEIDAFLLDRDSTFYREQDTVFQFLTPGMLTKINDLRQAAKCIFIIATNYENRIDPAIKRPGRIDQQYLLLPPASARRAAIIKSLTDEDADAGQLRDSLYLGYPEIKKGVASQAKGQSLAAALKAITRSTGPYQFGQRVFIESKFPEEEAACLFQLSRQVGEQSAFENEFRTAAVRAAGEMPASARDEKIDRVWKAVVAKADSLAQSA